MLMLRETPPCHIQFITMNKFWKFGWPQKDKIFQSHFLKMAVIMLSNFKLQSSFEYQNNQ